MVRIALITNNPPPYRIPVFERLGKMPGVHFQVIFCSKREPYREWDVPPLNFDHLFLRERFFSINDRYLHHNPDVFPALKRFQPDVIVTDGFFPTPLYAFGYAVAKGIAHVPFTDGTDISERKLSKVHKLIRRVVYARSGAFLSASIGGDRLFQSYGIPAERCFRSYLCIDNDAFSPEPGQAKKQYDFIFCGRFEQGKSPLFALQVAVETANRMKRKIKILFVGSGSLEQSLRTEAARHADHIEARFHGYATQQELPALYRSARLFLFPTQGDVWGVVANEACAAGLPVIVSPHAGVVGELVLNGQNGFVCDLDVGLWADRATLLLMQPDVWKSFSKCSLSLVREYTFDNAAAGFLAACRYALPATKPGSIKMPGREVRNDKGGR
jgi:glycosyltransferase involved in cell wall biosynthesis